MKKIDFSLEALEPFFQAIEKLTPLHRYIIFGATLLLLGGGFYFLAFQGQWDEINRLTKEQKTLEKKLAAAKKKAAQLEKVRAQRKKAQKNFNIAKKALPNTKEIPSLLTAISKSGQDSGLQFLSFKPRAEKRKDFYAEIPVAIKVTGRYHDVVTFFDKVATLPRVVNIRNISMGGRKKGDRLTTNCTAVTYKFVKAKPKKKKKSRRRRRRR